MSRMVQCPSCGTVLHEPPPGTPFYQCGACFSVLQASHAIFDTSPSGVVEVSARRQPQRNIAPSATNGVASQSPGQPASSGGQATQPSSSPADGGSVWSWLFSPKPAEPATSAAAPSPGAATPPQRDQQPSEAAGGAAARDSAATGSRGSSSGSSSCRQDAHGQPPLPGAARASTGGGAAQFSAPPEDALSRMMTLPNSVLRPSPAGLTRQRSNANAALHSAAQRARQASVDLSNGRWQSGGDSPASLPALSPAGPSSGASASPLSYFEERRQRLHAQRPMRSLNSAAGEELMRSVTQLQRQAQAAGVGGGSGGGRLGGEQRSADGAGPAGKAMSVGRQPMASLQSRMEEGARALARVQAEAAAAGRGAAAQVEGAGWAAMMQGESRREGMPARSTTGGREVGGVFAGSGAGGFSGQLAVQRQQQPVPRGESQDSAMRAAAAMISQLRGEGMRVPLPAARDAAGEAAERDRGDKEERRRRRKEEALRAGAAQPPLSPYGATAGSSRADPRGSLPLVSPSAASGAVVRSLEDGSRPAQRREERAAQGRREAADGERERRRQLQSVASVPPSAMVFHTDQQAEYAGVGGHGMEAGARRGGGDWGSEGREVYIEQPEERKSREKKKKGRREAEAVEAGAALHPASELERAWMQGAGGHVEASGHRDRADESGWRGEERVEVEEAATKPVKERRKGSEGAARHSAELHTGVLAEREQVPEGGVTPRGDTKAEKVKKKKKKSSASVDADADSLSTFSEATSLATASDLLSAAGGEEGGERPASGEALRAAQGEEERVPRLHSDSRAGRQSRKKLTVAAHARAPSDAASLPSPLSSRRAATDPALGAAGHAGRGAQAPPSAGSSAGSAAASELAQAQLQSPSMRKVRSSEKVAQAEAAARTHRAQAVEGGGKGAAGEARRRGHRASLSQVLLPVGVAGVGEGTTPRAKSRPSSASKDTEREGQGTERAREERSKGRRSKGEHGSHNGEATWTLEVGTENGVEGSADSLHSSSKAHKKASVKKSSRGERAAGEEAEGGVGGLEQRGRTVSEGRQRRPKADVPEQVARTPTSVEGMAEYPAATEKGRSSRREGKEHSRSSRGSVEPVEDVNDGRFGAPTPKDVKKSSKSKVKPVVT